jgi:purine-nucleoside phosphorylase
MASSLASRISHDALHASYGSFLSDFRKHSAAAPNGSADAFVDGLVISGSGLNTVLERYPAETVVHADQIAGFPQAGVIGHSSSIRIVTIEGKRMAHFTGRCHLYEGFSMQQALAQIGLGALLGARFAVLTNSAGGLDTRFQAGDVMLIDETLNLMFRPVLREWMAAQSTDDRTSTLPSAVPQTSSSPLQIKASAPLLDPVLRRAISTELTRQAVPHKEGTYIAVTGPTYETPAEARAYRRLGGSAIGMSTVHEAEFARACGLQVAACSLITNTLPETLPVTVSHDEVVEAAKLGALNVAAFIAAACRLAS